MPGSSCFRGTLNLSVAVIGPLSARL